MKGYRGEIITLVLLLLVAAAVAWWWDEGHDDGEPSPGASASAAPTGGAAGGVAGKDAALALLAKVPRGAQSHWDSYTRESFGDPLWTDDTDTPGAATATTPATTCCAAT